MSDSEEQSSEQNPPADIDETGQPSLGSPGSDADAADDSAGDAVARFFVDGGFAQVSRNVVNVLTPKALPAAEVTADKAQAARAEAEAITSIDAVTRASRARALARARGLEKVAAKAATA